MDLEMDEPSGPSDPTRSRKRSLPHEPEEEPKRARLEDSDDSSMVCEDPAADPQVPRKRKAAFRPTDLLSDSDEDAVPQENTYSKFRVHGVRGYTYQLKLVKLFLIRALEEDFDFKLGTEVDEAAKFDDVVFMYKSDCDPEPYKVRFVQAKHKHGEHMEITMNELLKRHDVDRNDFSLQKYFISYRIIKEHPSFSKYTLEDLIIYTNIDFDDSVKECIKIDEVEEDLLMTTVPDREVKFCKLVIQNSHELYDKLRETADLHVLVQAIKQHIHENKRLDLIPAIFKRYHAALGKHVFDFSYNRDQKKVAKFRKDFVNGQNLPADVGKFQDYFRSVFQSNSDDLSWVNVIEKELPVSEGFGEQIMEKVVSPTISDSSMLAKRISQYVSDSRKANKHIIAIDKRVRVIAANINMLAYHVLVQDDTDKNLAIFRSEFLDDSHDNKLKGNIKEFKTDLKSELGKLNLDVGVLAECKLKINAFNICKETPEGVLLYPVGELPKDLIEDSEIEDFFNKLTFAINQPNEVQLGNIIAREIGLSKFFDLLNTDLVYSALETIILNWFKEQRPETGKEGVWLNANSGRRLIKSIKDKIRDLVSSGITVTYRDKLAAYGVKIKSNGVSEEVKKFLSTEKAFTFLNVIAPEETLLSALNIYCTLQDLAEYERNDSHIFVEFKALLRSTIQEYVLGTFKSKDNCHLLIIDCDSVPETDEMTELFNKISRSVRKTSKKIILILTKANACDTLEKTMFSLNDVTNFRDLTEKSKEFLLKKQVKFQGRRVSFDKLIDKSDEMIDEIIDTGIVHVLLKGNEISIGEKPQDLGDVKKYFIPRGYRQIYFCEDNIKKYLDESTRLLDMFVINGANCRLENENIFVMNSEENAENKFNELVHQYPSSNIHWLEGDSGNFTWCKSHGAISNVFYRFVEEAALVRDDNQDGVIIISDVAGMGKSTILSHLSMELIKDPSNLWVIRINLLARSTALNSILDKKLVFNSVSTKKLAAILLHDLLILQKKPSKLEENLFYNYLTNSSGRIVFLFDGFDEISPRYKDVVMDLMQTLKKCKVGKLIVTTRPNLRKDVEKALQVISHELVPWSTEEKIKMLSEFWMNDDISGEKLIKLQKYVKCIINQFSHFISIPLHAMMVAEVFKRGHNRMEPKYKFFDVKNPEWQSCEEFLASQDSEPKLTKLKFSVVDLYDHFIKRKFYQFYLAEKTNRDFDITDAEYNAEPEFNNFVHKYELLALQTFMSTRQLKKILSDEEMQMLERWVADFKTYKNKEGFVHLFEDGRAHFVHQTFTEYFASSIIAKKLLSMPAEALHCMEHSLPDMSSLFIHNIIKQIDGKQDIITKALNKELLHFVAIKSYRQVTRCLLQAGYDDWPQKLDNTGKTPLHYAAENNYVHLVRGLLNYNKHGFINYGNIKDNYGKTALHYAICQNHIDCALQLTFLMVEISDDDLDTIISNNLLTHPNNMIREGFIIKITKQLLKANTKFREMNLANQISLLVYFVKEKRVQEIDSLLERINDEQHRSNLLSTMLDFINIGFLPLDVNNKYHELFTRSRFCSLRVHNLELHHDKDILEIAKHLSAYGASTPNSSDVIENILEVAYARGYLETFEYFISQVNGYDQRYLKFLFKECEHNSYNLRVIKTYFKNHININIALDALEAACTSNSKNKVLTYLNDLICTNSMNDKGETSQLLEDKIALFKNPKYVGENRSPSLHIAIESSNLEWVKFLLGRGSDIHTTDIEGNTPLHVACKVQNVDIFKLLIKYGAIYNQENTKKETPRDLVNQSNEIVTYFKILDEMFVNTPNFLKVIDEEHFFMADKYKNMFPKDKRFAPYPELASDLRNGFFLCARDCEGQTLFHKIAAKTNDGILSEKVIEMSSINPSLPWAPRCMLINVRDYQGNTALHIAAQNNHYNVVILLLKEGAIFKCTNVEKETAEMVAKKRDHLNIVKVIQHTESIFNALEKKDESTALERIKEHTIIARNESGRTPVHLAASFGQIAVLQWLFNNGAYVESKADPRPAQTFEPRVISALREPLAEHSRAVNEKFSLRRVHSRLTSVIKSRKARIARADGTGESRARAWTDICDLNKNTPLHCAAENDEFKTVKLLLKRGAFYNNVNVQDQTPFELAKGKSRDLLGQIDLLFNEVQRNACDNLIRYMKSVSEKYDIDMYFMNDIRDDCDKTLLHYAIMSRKYDVVVYLLQNGGIIEKHYTQKYGSDEFIINLFDDLQKLFNNILLLRHRKMNEEDLFDSINTTCKNNTNVDLKMITNVRDHNKKGMLYYAIWCRSLPLVKCLIDKGAYVDLMDINYIIATRGIGLEIVKHLIDNGNVNVTNDEEKTPLMKAIASNVNSLQYQECADVIKHLVDKGADVNKEDIFGNTPLSLAVEGDHDGTIKYLISKGAYKISETASQLMKDKVAYFKNPAGYDLNFDENGVSKLQAAIKAGDFQFAEFLVRNDGKVDIVDDCGNSPLHLVCGAGGSNDFDVRWTDLFDRADVNAVNTNGDTPLHLACKTKNSNVAIRLLQRGAVFDKRNNLKETPRDMFDSNDSNLHVYWLLKLLDGIWNTRNVSDIVQAFEFLSSRTKISREFLFKVQNSEGVTLKALIAADSSCDVESLINKNCSPIKE